MPHAKPSPRRNPAGAKGKSARQMDSAAIASVNGPHSVKNVALLYGVTTATVLGWIRAGELAAVNVSRSRHSKKPRWRITQSALDAFEAARGATPPAPRAQRRKSPPDVIEFFPVRGA